MNSVYLQEQAVDYLVQNFWDGNLLATSNLTITASELSPQESEMECYPTPLSSAMSEHSLVKGTPKAIRDWLMSLPEDSPASRSVSQESNLEPMTPETCGRQHLTASASYDPDTHSWKTCQGWLLADILEPSFQDFTKAGMTVDGAFYPQPNWERRINEIAYGLEPNGETFFHTPTTGGLDGGSNSRKALKTRREMWLSPTATNIAVRSEEAMKKRKDYRESIGRKTVPPGNLAEQVTYGSAVKSIFPTPTVDDAHNATRKSGKFQSLTRTIMYPTPTVNDSKNSTLPPSQINHDNLPGALLRDGEQPGGRLNPDWVEWLMGWVTGWTSLEPLPPESFAQWMANVESYWQEEPSIPRVADGINDRVNRLKAIGNGQVPICASTAFLLLSGEDL